MAKIISKPSPTSSNLVARTPIFYGWVIWVVGAIGLIATSPGQSYSVSLFVDKFITDLQLDRATVSGLYGGGTFLASLTLIWVGKQIDKYGNRKTGVVISVLFAIALVLFSKVSGPLALFLGFVAIRGLGQGSLSMTSSTAIARWFQRKRGRVTGYAIVVLFLFQGYYIPMLQELIERVGWRQAWVILGIGVGLTILPLTWVLMRDKPEDFGLLPDGGPGKKAEKEIVHEEHWRLREVQRTSLFWVFLFGRFAPAAWGTGLIFHQLSIFNLMGHPPSAVSTTYAKISIIAAVVSIFAGYMIDNWRPGVIIALQLFMLGLAMGTAMVMQADWMLWIYAGFFGLMMGSGSSFDGAVWANLFGRDYLGEIRGFTTMILAAGTAVGPVLFGLSFNYFGDYMAALWIGIAWAILAAVLSLRVKMPERKEVSI